MSAMSSGNSGVLPLSGSSRSSAFATWYKPSDRRAGLSYQALRESRATVRCVFRPGSTLSVEIGCSERLGTGPRMSARSLTPSEGSPTVSTSHFVTFANAAIPLSALSILRLVPSLCGSTKEETRCKLLHLVAAWASEAVSCHSGTNPPPRLRMDSSTSRGNARNQIKFSRSLLPRISMASSLMRMSLAFCTHAGQLAAMQTGNPREALEPPWATTRPPISMLILS